MAKYVKYSLLCVMCAFLFNLTAYLGAGISSVFSIIFFSAVYFVLQLAYFIKLSKDKIGIYCVYLILTILLSALIYYLLADTDMFVRIFMTFNASYGSPNAGDGLGVILCYNINRSALLCSTLIGVFNILIKILINKKHRSEVKNHHENTHA